MWARPHIEPYVELDFPYKKFDISGFSGSHYKVLSLDNDSGACTLKVKFDGGYKRKPGLSYSDMEMLVLTGRMKVGDQVCNEGHYMFVPAGMHVGAISVPQGCEVLLMYNDSEPSWGGIRPESPAGADRCTFINEYIHLCAVGGLATSSVRRLPPGA